jgi:hypothetical protein
MSVIVRRSDLAATSTPRRVTAAGAIVGEEVRQVASIVR